MQGSRWRSDRGAPSRPTPGSRRGTHLRLVRLLAAWVVGLAAVSVTTPARACTINCDTNVPKTCTCSASPCSIVNQHNYSVETVWNCSGKDVVLEGGNGSITVTNAQFTLKADDLDVTPGQHIDAQASVPDTGFGIALELTGKLDVGGYLRASSPHGGGTITVRAVGDVRVPPPPPVVQTGLGILAEATNYGGSGGHIEIETDGVLLTDNPISVDASIVGPAHGGSITIRAANITLGETLSASGKNDDAGTIELIASSDEPGKGNIVVQDRIAAEGAGSVGNGGTVEMTADAGITLNHEISVQGGVGAPGQTSGGRVILQSGTGGVSIADDINATSGALGSDGRSASAISVDSTGPITVYAGVTLVTRSDRNGGDGGSIVLNSDDDVTIGNATLDASGDYANQNQGPGGHIQLVGCDVTVASGATLRAEGQMGGGIEFTAGAQLDVRSTTVDADGNGGADGSIDLNYRSATVCANEDPTGVRPICVVGDVCRGRCSNSPATVCSTNQNCTIGCSTGVCQAKRCQSVDVPACNADADCNVCASLGGCVANPLTASTSFTPSAPTLREHPGLARCEQLSDEE